MSRRKLAVDERVENVVSFPDRIFRARRKVVWARDYREWRWQIIQPHAMFLCVFLAQF